MKMRHSQQETVLLFDGVCNLCNGVVQFIIPRDRSESIHFASLQSPIAKQLLAQYHYPADQINSIVLIENGRLYTKSTAALRIARKLRGAWPIFYVFNVLPTPLRDALYDVVARNRYKWFGKQETCKLPRPEWKHRFLD